MRQVLILGGTAWLGRQIAIAAADAGAEVTCAARGESGSAPDDATFIQLDRLQPDAYSPLLQEWDEVIELSHEPELVGPALDSLASCCRHWTLVSSVSVYAHTDEAGSDESAATVDVVDTSEYAQAKVAAENAARRAIGDRLLVVRPGLIVGPGDPSDRFGYWPARLAEAGLGDVLTPVTDGRHVQVIDVDDLSGWIVKAGGQQRTGIIDAVGPVVGMGAFFTQTSEVTAFQGAMVPADDVWLTSHDVRYWGGPRSLPLWLPQGAAALAERSGAAFRAAGGVTRPLDETLRRALAEEMHRGLTRERHSGLTRAEEVHLLGVVASEQSRHPLDS